MEKNEHPPTTPAANTAGGNAVPRPRLPYPAPPSVAVEFSSRDRPGLQRLCKVTGLSPGEVGANLLEHELSAKPASAPLPEIAAALRRVYQQSCCRLATVVFAKADGAPAPASGQNPNDLLPVRIQVPLSRDMNRPLYALAVDAGLDRGDVSCEWLSVAIHRAQTTAQDLEQQAARLKNLCDPTWNESAGPAAIAGGAP